MNKHIRLLYLINVLSGEQDASVGALARRCNVSRRTIYRDIKNIVLAGFPVCYDSGYRILKSKSMPPGNFDYYELEALESVVEKAKCAYDGSDREVLSIIEAKIGRAIAEYPSERPGL